MVEGSEFLEGVDVITEEDIDGDVLTEETLINESEPEIRHEPVRPRLGGMGGLHPLQTTSLEVDVDVVFVIDATGSMTPFLDHAKLQASRFMDGLETALTGASKRVRNVRIKVIAYRDFYHDSEPIIQSRFFNMNDATDANRYKEFLSRIEAMGGGDEPENALEALHIAMNSEWSYEEGAQRRRQIIVVMTDASAHPLDHASRATCTHPDYPTSAPRDLVGLQGEWMGQAMQPKAKRMAIFAPNTWPWTELSNWNQVTPYPSAAGEGVSEADMSLIYAYIAASI